MPEKKKPTRLVAMKSAWIDENNIVLAMFGNSAASEYLFNQLSDEQAVEFLRLLADNNFDRTQWCIRCESELNYGNHICPKCGLDNEDK
jgi:hypothetical protein